MSPYISTIISVVSLSILGIVLSRIVQHRLAVKIIQSRHLEENTNEYRFILQNQESVPIDFTVHFQITFEGVEGITNDFVYLGPTSNIESSLQTSPMTLEVNAGPSVVRYHKKDGTSVIFQTESLASFDTWVIRLKNVPTVFPKVKFRVYEPKSKLLFGRLKRIPPIELTLSSKSSVVSHSSGLPMRPVTATSLSLLFVAIYCTTTFGFGFGFHDNWELDLGLITLILLASVLVYPLTQSSRYPVVEGYTEPTALIEVTNSEEFSPT